MRTEVAQMSKSTQGAEGHGANVATDQDYSQPILPGRGESDYERYLRTDDPGERVHHDELLFQVVHQSSELWLKLAGSELEEATRLLESENILATVRILRRAVRSLDYVTAQLSMLTELDPWEYQRIRVVLGHGSGFDSPGFRRLPQLTARLGHLFADLLASHGLDLESLYQHGREHEDLYALAEALTDWDERVWLWRFRHYSVVARSLGEHTVGTQGTPVEVLGKLIAQRQLPRLWHVRSRLVELFDAQR